MENTMFKITDSLQYIINQFNINKINSLDFEFSNTGTDLIVNKIYRAYTVDLFNNDEIKYLYDNKECIINYFN